MEELTSKVEQLKSGKQRLESSHDMLISLELQIKTVEQNLSSVTQQLDYSKQECTRVTKLLQKSEQERAHESEAYEHAMGQLKLEIHQVDVTIGELQSVISRLQDGKEEAENQLEDQAENIQMLEAKLVTLRREYHLQLGTLKKQCSQLSAEAESFKALVIGAPCINYASTIIDLLLICRSERKFSSAAPVSLS